MIRSSFFNSIAGDRKYDASKFAEYFNSFIGDGVFPIPTDGLQVMSNDNMTVTVLSGKAWINGYLLINDDDYILPIDVADGVLKRIDRVVARLDFTTREIRVEVKKGAFASSPVVPSLQRDTDAYELGIADVLISNGVVSIIQGNITDLRSNTELCGKVDSLIAGDINSLVASLNEHKENNAAHVWQKISEVTLTEATAQIDFANIPTGYKYFRLIFEASASSISDLDLIFNGDVSSTYRSQTISANYTELAAEGVLPVGRIILKHALCTNPNLSLGHIDISNSNASRSKTINGEWITDQGTGVNLMLKYIIGGKWQNATAEINKISIKGASPIAISSRFTLWGCR